MVVGIAAGLLMSGLLVGAISGSIWLLLGFSAVGFIIAAAAEIRTARITAASCKYAQYPPYGY